MPRYLVTTQRSLRGSAVTALAAVENEEGVHIVRGDDPDMVTIEMPEKRASSLADKLKDTHSVEPEVRRTLH